MSQPRDTPLTEQHRSLGARLVDFAGFRMPLQYSGILDEHRAVRTAAGLFDVSHMGQLLFSGEHAISVLQRLVTNDLQAVQCGQALYTPICNHQGGIVDDCLIYRQPGERALVIVNASNIAKDFAWMVAEAQGRCEIENASDRHSLLALQGPRAEAILATLIGQRASEIGRFRFVETEVAQVPCTVARTGYTGEDGFELLCPNEHAVVLWQALLTAGTPQGLKPVGLGARDTLRLEARLLLYGNDIDGRTTPLEAGLGWAVKFDKPGDFIGKSALLDQRASGLRRRLCCLVMRSRGIARQGHAICNEATDAQLGPRVGRVTSGTMSPTLNQAIALGYVERALAKTGQRLLVDVRGRAVQAEVIKGPFYRAAD